MLVIVVVVVFVVVVFFFQAEDGIRDLVRSRGLGDVYKRQMWSLAYHLARTRIVTGSVKALAGNGTLARSSHQWLSLIHI